MTQAAQSQMIIPVTCPKPDCRYTWFPRKVGPVKSCPRCKARLDAIAPRRKGKVAK